MAQCRITEIFYSLQGETRTIGLPTVFVRLTGCPLRCGYCDTAYAFTGGEKMEIADIVEQVSAYNPRYVTVTGGEPLAQKTCYELLTTLCDLNVEVSLETSGAIDISNVDPRVVCVMDIKTPASGEEAKNIYANIDKLKPDDPRTTAAWWIENGLVGTLRRCRAWAMSRNQTTPPAALGF